MRITVNTVDRGSGSVLLNTSNYRLNVRDCQDSVRLHRHGAHLPLELAGRRRGGSQSKDVTDGDIDRFLLHQSLHKQTSALRGTHIFSSGLRSG